MRIAIALLVVIPAFCQLPKPGSSGGSGGGGGGTVTGVTATAPIVSSGGTAPVISGTYEGNGSKIQLFTGTDPATNSCGSFDANHNLTGPANCTVDASGNVGVNSLSVTGAGVTQITLGGSPQFGINAQAATYQVLAADFVACKTITVASGTFTITLVASGGSQPANGQCLTVDNYGTGTVTLARSGQNINGGTASLILPPGTALTPTGAYITSNGTNYFAQLFGKSPPQVTALASGTAATYTTPPGASAVQVECVGGGGGGAGSGTSPGASVAGTNTTFGTLTSGGGGGGVITGTSTGGTATGGDINIPGTSGGTFNGYTFFPGFNGANSFFGGGGSGGTSAPGNGAAAATNSGSGGGGAGNGSISAGFGGGGSAGGYVRKLFAPPSTTYTYTIGAGGAGGTLGISGAAGGSGAAGICVATASFQ